MSAEERMLDAILTYLARRLGPRAVLRGVRLDVEADGLRQQIRLRPASLGVSPEDDDAPQTSIRRAVLDVLAEAGGALKGQAIARRAGRSYSGTFRATLAAMVREGVIVLGVEGYAAADAEDEAEDSDSDSRGQDSRDSQADGRGG